MIRLRATLTRADGKQAGGAEASWSVEPDTTTAIAHLTGLLRIVHQPLPGDRIELDGVQAKTAVQAAISTTPNSAPERAGCAGDRPFRSIPLLLLPARRPLFVPGQQMRRVRRACAGQSPASAHASGLLL